eukprot:6494863-Karenia_brevis.AAC.1
MILFRLSSAVPLHLYYLRHSAFSSLECVTQRPYVTMYFVLQETSYIFSSADDAKLTGCQFSKQLTASAKLWK